MSSPWLFVAWGMDVTGPIKPKASNDHRFILVIIDYFTSGGDYSQSRHQESGCGLYMLQHYLPL